MVATFMFGNSYTLAAPVVPFGDQATTSVNCVKLTGRSDTFLIGTSLRKREDPPSLVSSAVGTLTDANKLDTLTEQPSLPVVDTTAASSPEEASTAPLNTQDALKDSTDADPSGPVSQESATSALDTMALGGLVDPTVPVAPITDAPVFPEIPKDSPQESTPTYPNLPIAVVEEPKRKPTPGEIFAKYAAAGAGILSTIGVGVGGLVGGLIGGTAGLVIGLLLAAANASFHA
ncbi:hypothetical protein EC968_003166 [Mortierella alpina]|nr:hypothetical protein EC968_003166 [Mortierella alpina]